MLGRPSPFSVVWHHGLEQFIAAAHLALIVYAFILGAGHYLRAMVIRRQEQLRAERLRADLASAQLRALTLQLQPHFLFNALNAVGALIITERNREAFEVIGRLGELLRGLLATERREEVSLREELELAESYVGIERARLGERLRVTWDVAPDIGSAQLPPMLLQPLVENAIRHGVSKSPAGGCLTIHAWRDETRLAIDVADDGPGFPTQTDEMHESRHPGTERCSRARGRRRTARTGWLRAILREEHGLSIVGESSGGAEAIAAIEALSPDLVFLDIALPDLDGFDVVDRIRTDRRPAIVFVTAHSDQALRAFETRALDYVTKPIRRERVREAVARARERIRLERLDRQPAPPSAAPMDGPLALKIDAKVQLIDQQSIDWVEADDDHVVVHCGDRLWRARETLREAAGRLDPTRFVQIHRSTVVRLGAVRELQSWFHGDYIVILHSGAKLRLSRSFRDAVASRLGRAL